MKARIITGLLLGAAAIAMLTLAPPVVTYAVLQLASLVIADEFFRITLDGRYPRDRWVGMAAVAILVAVSWWQPTYVPLVLLAGVLGLISLVLFSDDEVERMAPRVGMLITGFAYTGGLLVPLVLLTADFGTLWVLLLFAGVFAGDSGAFFAGKFLGNKKLYPKISPKKTWAGSFGGVAGSVLGVFIVDALAAEVWAPAHHLVIIGVGIAVFEQVGDLAESLFKRAFDVKDSGSLLPGHGGLLDRVDGVLFAGPFLWAYLTSAVPS